MSVPSYLRVLGLDLSLRQTGYCLLQGKTQILHGAIGFPELRGGERLNRFHRWLITTLSRYRPDHVAIEGYSFGSPFRATDLAELGGVVKLTVFEFDLPLSIVQVPSWRKELCGRNVKKESVAALLLERHGVSFPRLDTLEAWAVAEYARRQLSHNAGNRPTRSNAR